MKIGGKLAVGFGILVMSMLVMLALAYIARTQAITRIDTISQVRMPTTLVSAHAQANLLRMLGDLRGYLALGGQQFRDNYTQSSQAFEADMAELERLSSQFDSEDKRRIADLKTTYTAWSALPDQLFALRDDQLKREPAYRLLATDGSRQAGRILIDINTLIDKQARLEPSEQGIMLIQDMARFQETFASMLSALRGYVTTRNRVYKREYEANLKANQDAWENLTRKQDRLAPPERDLLGKIGRDHKQFMNRIPNQLFEIVESNNWRTDLDLFTTEALPRMEKMQELLKEITDDQQQHLEGDLHSGINVLKEAARLNLVIGILAVFLAILMALVFNESIAGPIRRLTLVAEQIRRGDLEVLARVESCDEVGTLAETFNNMTNQLRQIVVQVRAEKKRADDLLEVVIPIGVALSSEKDFNRLLENILMEAKTFCHADGGALYLRTDDNQLKYVILCSDSRKIALGGMTGQPIPFQPMPLYDPATGEPNHRNVAVHAALSGSSVNIPNAYQAADFDIEESKACDEGTGYPSLLTIPLKSAPDRAVGVLQLHDAQDPQTGRIIPFDANLQQMMESYSSLAVAALEAYIREQSLRREIKQLRIEIDQVKRQQQVKEIVETDFFQDLQSKVRDMRKRNSAATRDIPGEQAAQPSDSVEDTVAVDQAPPGSQAE
jgi:CHASE3 domain sensor protein